VQLLEVLALPNQRGHQVLQQQEAEERVQTN
jgi:hypothetical protein